MFFLMGICKINILESLREIINPLFSVTYTFINLGCERRIFGYVIIFSRIDY